MAEPVALLLVIIALGAIMKRVGLGLEQGFLVTAAFVLPFVAVVWMMKAHRSVSAGNKSLALLADTAVWFGIAYLAVELEVVSQGIHQPGGPLLMVFPVAALFIGALVYGVLGYR
jgi:hypothetical protein